mmetsp:Transcript_9352/g.14175  ORF Transcript_9352/g.14175 Transcript_9352/m.14175 type:complete len:148 (+) Transcript_9352:1060-1503(+)
MKDQRDYLQDEHRRQRVDVNFYGLGSSTEVNPVFNASKLNQCSADRLDLLSECCSENKITHKKKRYEELSPSERNLKKQDLLMNFKSNVMSVANLSQPDRPLRNGHTNFTVGNSIAEKNMGDLVATLSHADTFSQRMLERNKKMGFL